MALLARLRPAPNASEWSMAFPSRDARQQTSMHSANRGCSPPSWTSALDLNLQSAPEPGSNEDLISPHWAGVSTLVLALGCCGFAGPVPSATLDKRCLRKQQPKIIKSNYEVKSRLKILSPVACLIKRLGTTSFRGT